MVDHCECECVLVCASVPHCNTLQHTATHCNTLRHTPQCSGPMWMHHCNIHCNTLQHSATHCITLHRTATHCNTLQHTATHCNACGVSFNTLQHTATHCTTMCDCVLFECRNIGRLFTGSSATVYRSLCLDLSLCISLSLSLSLCFIRCPHIRINV